MTTARPTFLARALKTIANVEPRETTAVVVSFVYFALLMGSYFIVRPVRDAMGTVYGVGNLQELYTGTFAASFVLAPAYAWLASRIRLATFPSRLPVLHLDRIYTRGLKPLHAQVPRGRAWARMSDHLPLIAEFAL